MPTLRQLEPEDYYPIVSVADAWWGGRPVSGILLRLFFEHFRPTSFVMEEDGGIAGFLIGFPSETNSAWAYIHAVATDPRHRGQGLARQLYERFFETIRELGCREVFSITSPANNGSITFHTRMGFEILPGDGEIDGVAVTTNYDGRDGARVLFHRCLDATKPL
jgi:GNAT superfamily N-acetyltransferase